MVIKCTHRADGVADDYTTAMAVTDTAIHEIDVLPWLVNDEWDEVQCIMPKTNSKVKNALKDPQIMIMKTKGGIINMLEVNVNCGFGYDINCEVVCENGVVNLPCPSFPTVRYANQVSTKIEDNWILRFIDSYDVEIQDWVDHALKGETGGSSAWDGYVASITADALVKSRDSGVPEKVVTGGTPDFYKKYPPRIFYSLLLTRKGGRASCFTALAYHLNHYTAFYNVKFDTLKGVTAMKIGFNEGCNRFCGKPLRTRRPRPVREVRL